MASLTPQTLQVGIIIVSTTAFSGTSTDLTTQILVDLFDHANATKASSTAPEWSIRTGKIVPDDPNAITDAIKSCTDDEDFETLDLVVLSGGTGFAQSDCTPEVVSSLLHRHAPGLVHAMLATSFKITPFAAMSRPVAGTRFKSLIVTLPGSPKGAKENLESIIRLLPHACIQNAGLIDSRKLHSGGVKKLEAEAGVTSDKSSHSHVKKEPGHHSCGHHHHHHRHSKDIDPSERTRAPGESVTRRHRASPYPMITVDEAHQLIAQHTPQPKVIDRPVDNSLIGYILAEDIVSTEPVPAFRASIVDGYAVIGADGPGTYPVTSISHAAKAQTPFPELQTGQIARITTGAPVPDGADAVVMVEDTKLITTTEDGKEELTVEILASNMGPDENIRQIGSDIALGEVILTKGTEVTGVGGEIGLLRSIGLGSVKVYYKPVVGVISTGDEVLDSHDGEPLKTGQIRDCNRPSLLAALSSWGFQVVDLGIAKDEESAISTTLSTSLQKVNVVISTGGVSMGERDLLKPILQHTLNGTIHFGRVAMKPGKPTTFATYPVPPSTTDSPQELENTFPEALLFALPGNPASALVTFHLFVLPALRRLSGFPEDRTHLPKVQVTLGRDVAIDPRPEFHRAVVRFDRAVGGLVAESTGVQRSSRVGSMLSANALLCVPALDDASAIGEKRKHRGKIPAGKKIDVILLGQIGGF
ncbi:hypothetical protein DFH27DRAFT_642558 [Peziza echinospora]|nr:hypothetical protein DFH27DRAFT_642558 [Peziza echinospora]